MSVVKWLLYGLVGAVVLMVLAIIVLPLVMDSEALKKQLASRIEQKTGHSFQIEGPLQWSVFPWIGLEIGRVTVGNAPGFVDEPLATVEELDVKVALKPLFFKQVVADTVFLRGVHLNLVRNSAGRGNWEIFVSDEKEQGKKVQKKKTPEKSGESAGGGLVLELNGLAMEDVTLRFEDQQKDSTIEIRDLALDIGKLVPDSPVPVQLWFGLASTEPDLNLKVGLTSSFSISRDWQRLDFRDLGVDLKVFGAGLPDQGLHFELTGDLGLDRAQEELRVSELFLSGPGTEISTSLKVTGLDGQPRVSGKLDLKQVNPRELMQQLGLALKTRDREALTRLSGTVAVIQEGDTLVLKPVSLQLDDTAVAGDIRVLSFAGPVVRVRITMDDIDLDRYLPPGPAKEKISPPGSASDREPTIAAASQDQEKGEPPSFDALRSLDMEAELRVGGLKVRDLRLQKIVVDMSARDGMIRLQPVQAELYDGHFSGDFLVDLRQATPKFQVSKNLVGISIGSLLKDLSGKEQLTGIGDVHVDVTTEGLAEAMMTSHLNGTMSFVLKDGSYKGINLAQVIRRARAALAGQEVAADQAQKTDFTELRGSAVIRQGVVENRDLYMASPVLRVTGRGKIDLVRKVLDYQVTAKVVGSLAGQGGKSGDELRGLAVPVRIKGPLDKPSYGVDMEAALKAGAAQQLEKKKQELLDKAAGKIQDRMGGQLLKGLLGQ